MTGSLNQQGEIQPIGGVNEKIEGFFDVCQAKGLTGTPGRAHPPPERPEPDAAADVVAAAAEGRFHVYAVRTIDEGIAMLTGVKAGRTTEEAAFTEGSVYDRVDKELVRLAQASKDFFEDRSCPKD